jgi:RNA polymerase sigma-70 factor (ECF subfamily)
MTLRRALARLPPEQRLALVAVVVQGMSYEQVAAATGCAAGTAKSRVFRARNSLHAMLLGPEATRRRPSAGGPGTRPEGVALALPSALPPAATLG